MNSHTVSLIGLANELPAEANGWVKLSPYGDFPKTRITRRSDGSLVEEKFLQRIDAQAAAVLERNFNSMWGRVKRFFVGTPVYKHHPDLARHQPGTVTSMTPSDGEPKGLFTGLEARADGLYARLVLLPAGHEAVEREGLKYLSPFWWVETVGTENGVTVVTPTELISAGLTQAPNIRGGEALDNSRGGESIGEEMRHALPRNDAVEGAARNDDEMNKSQIIQLLAQFGITLNPVASEPDILAAVRVLGERAVALTNEEAMWVGEREGWQTVLANERQERIEMILELAQRDGRIAPAQRDEWSLALANREDFDAKLAELVALPKVIKTTSRTLELAGRTVAIANQKELTTRAIELVQERMRVKGEDYDTAFSAVRRECPALFEAMQKPEIK